MCSLYRVFLQGIKVVDAESKQRVLDILKQEQAEKLMEVDDSAAAAKADGSSKKKAKKRSKVKLVTKTMTGTTSRKGAEPAAMED
jgi:ribosomal protein L19E